MFGRLLGKREPKAPIILQVQTEVEVDEETIERVLQAMTTLQPRDLQLIDDIYFGKMSQRQIAKQERVAQSTVSNRFNKVIDYLAKAVNS